MKTMKDLLINGFVIFNRNGYFVLKKDAVPENQEIIDEIIFEDYDLAFSKAIEFLNKKQIKEWKIIVRYNRGLGIEYKNFPSIFAESKEIGEKLAYELVSKSINPKFISQIKVRPKIYD